MNIITQLKRDEGEFKSVGRHAVYQDHLGYWTLGIGRLVDSRRGGGITDVEAEYLLCNDVRRIRSVLENRLKFWGTLNEVRQAALINMAFQMGVNGLLNFRKTLALIEQGNYIEASREALRSGWASQTPNRARRVSLQIETGEWQ